MKFQLLTLVLVVADACAMVPARDVVVVDFPDQQAPSAVVDDLIKQIIELISAGIKRAGLDPLEIKKAEFSFPSKPSAFTVKGHIENFKYDGASNIKINSLDHSDHPSKLSFNISLPQLSLKIGDSGIELTAFKHKFDGQLKGSLVTESIGLSGEVTVSVSGINHVNLDSITLNFGVGSIKSELSVSALGTDLSKFPNSLFNEIIPNALKKYGAAINAFMENIVKEVFFLINLIFKFY